MLQVNTNVQQPRRRRICVEAKLRCFVLSLILSNNTITNSISIRFKLKSKPTPKPIHSSFPWKKPNKLLAIFKSFRIRPPKKTRLHSPYKKYFKGRRTIWVWILVAIWTFYILITLLWNRLFTLKVIYKASKYAISSGLFYDIYQALLNRVSSSLLVPSH